MRNMVRTISVKDHFLDDSITLLNLLLVKRPYVFISFQVVHRVEDVFFHCLHNELILFLLLIAGMQLVGGGSCCRSLMRGCLTEGVLVAESSWVVIVVGGICIGCKIRSLV